MSKLELPTFSPETFFEIGADGRYFDPKKNKKLSSAFLIPNLFDEKTGVKFFLGWNEKGLLLKFEIPFACQKCSFPIFRRGDSVEFLFCTRSLKSSFLTKYHHHFVFFPEKVEGSLAKEVTRFRLSDRHEIALPSAFFVDAKTSPKSYTLDISLPKAVLFGYDPENFKELSFSYIVNRFHGRSFSFGAALDEYALEKKPSLWNKLFLKKA